VSPHAMQVRGVAFRLRISHLGHRVKERDRNAVAAFIVIRCRVEGLVQIAHKMNQKPQCVRTFSRIGIRGAEDRQLIGDGSSDAAFLRIANISRPSRRVVPSGCRRNATAVSQAVMSECHRAGGGVRQRIDSARLAIAAQVRIDGALGRIFFAIASACGVRCFSASSATTWCPSQPQARAGAGRLTMAKAKRHARIPARRHLRGKKLHRNRENKREPPRLQAYSSGSTSFIEAELMQ